MYNFAFCDHFSIKQLKLKMFNQIARLVSLMGEISAHNKFCFYDHLVSLGKQCCNKCEEANNRVYNRRIFKIDGN